MGTDFRILNSKNLYMYLPIYVFWRVSKYQGQEIILSCYLLLKCVSIFLMWFEYKSQLFLQSGRRGDLSVLNKQTNKQITFTTRGVFERKGVWSLLLARERTGLGACGQNPGAGLNAQDRSVHVSSRRKMYLFWNNLHWPR